MMAVRSPYVVSTLSAQATMPGVRARIELQCRTMNSIPHPRRADSCCRSRRGVVAAVPRIAFVPGVGKISLKYVTEP